MTLLAPALLAGLIGLGLPFLAHLLGHETPRIVRFAPRRFLPVVEPSITHRRSLYDIPLLALRAALLVVLVLIFLRPATRDRTGLAVIADAHNAVIVVDGSRSMGLTVAGESSLTAAVRSAHDVIAALPAGTRVGLCTSDPQGPQIQPTLDTQGIATALDTWVDGGAPRPGAWQLADAIPRASAWLRELPGERKRVIYAIGDATNRGLGSLPGLTENDVLIRPIRPHPDDTPRPEHIGIVDVQWTPAPDLDPRAVRITAQMHRFPGTAPLADDATTVVDLALDIDNTQVARTTVHLPVGTDTPVEFTHVLAHDAQTVAATISRVDTGDDPLPSDDTRHLWLSVHDGIKVLVVNGDPSELRAHDEVYFLTTAIAAGLDQADVRLRSLAPDQLEHLVETQAGGALSDTDVLVLANIRAPSAETAAIIAQRVDAGMGLWITVGNRVDPTAYNTAFRQLLPLALRGAVRIGTAPGREEARVEGFAPANLSHPMFRGHLAHDFNLGGARARRLMLLEPDARTSAPIALTLANGAPALITREVGQGRVAMLATTIDRDWTDLPLRPGFVSLVSGLLHYLADTRQGRFSRQILVGEPQRAPSTMPAQLQTPTGRKLSIGPDDEGMITITDTFVPGHYAVTIGDTTTSFAVNVDPIESATTVIVDARAEDDSLVARAELLVPWWRKLVVVAALLLAFEAWLRRSRTP